MILKRLKVNSGIVEQTNCYIVQDEETKEVMVIDPGGEPEKIGEMLSILGANLKYIYLTHCHGDHIGALKELKEAKGGKILIHRNDVEGYKNALLYFDKKLPEIIHNLKQQDILFITADHGCDPTTPSTDHSREYVPLLIYGKGIKQNVNLGIRNTFADLGQTISDYLDLNADFEAKSFLNDIQKG